jgi:23S rRNA (cytosine1962-C5)-methyltransferase
MIKSGEYKISVSSPLQYLDIIQIIESLKLPENAYGIGQAQRLFHGRGHTYKYLSHITVDWLPPVIWITLFAPVISSDIDRLGSKLLEKIPECKSIQIQHRYQKNWPVEVTYGDTINGLEITEGKLKYKLQLGSGRNIGLFLDMRNGREWVKLNSRDKHVLNLFAYTCGFSVSARAGNVASVYNVDISSSALSTGRDNHRINQQPLDNISFAKLNIFNSFGRLKKHGPFDLLICDPPTFQKGSIDIVRDYPKLMRRLDDFMAPISTLMLCINAPHLGQQTGREFLIEAMQENAPQFRLDDEIKLPEVYLDSHDKGLKTFIFKREIK